MKLTAILIILLLSSPCFAQKSDSLIGLVQTKRFSSLRSFLRDSHSSNGNLNSWNNTLREIIPNYWEGIILLDEWHKGKLRYVQYQIDLLSTAEEVFFYRITKIKYLPEGGYDYRVDSVVEKYNNDIIYRRFEKEFNFTCGTMLKKDELFLSSAVYGHACGIAGSSPLQRQKLTSFLLEWDYNEIASWLRSPNTEKQLYAMEGLKILENNGIPIKKDDRSLMMILKQKKGMVRTCAGCFSQMESTKALAQNIDTLKTTFHIPHKSHLNNSALYVCIGILLLLSTIVGVYYIKRKGKIQSN